MFNSQRRKLMRCYCRMERTEGLIQRRKLMKYYCRMERTEGLIQRRKQPKPENENVQDTEQQVSKYYLLLCIIPRYHVT